jgi:hypothetical protein
MAILDELKAKAGGKADKANNIQEAVSMMEFGSGGSSETEWSVTFTDDGSGNITSDKDAYEVVSYAISQPEKCVAYFEGKKAVAVRKFSAGMGGYNVSFTFLGCDDSTSPTNLICTYIHGGTSNLKFHRKSFNISLGDVIS